MDPENAGVDWTKKENWVSNIHSVPLCVFLLFVCWWCFCGRLSSSLSRVFDQPSTPSVWDSESLRHQDLRTAQTSEYIFFNVCFLYTFSYIYFNCVVCFVILECF